MPMYEMNKAWFGPLNKEPNDEFWRSTFHHGLWSNYIDLDRYRRDVIIIQCHDLGLGHVVFERYSSTLGLCKLPNVSTSVTILEWWKSQRMGSALGNLRKERYKYINTIINNKLNGHQNYWLITLEFPILIY